MKTISEGEVKILTDEKIFYNPDAEFIRDISVAALQVFSNESNGHLKICDAFSATGARGIRFAKEVSGVKEAFLCDKNPKSVELIKKNIKANKLEKICKPIWADCRKTFQENIFDFIDLDPFGSPAEFLDSAASSIFHKGFVGITATDTAALCGSKAEAGMRKYGIRLFKTDFYNELGLRALITFAILTFSRHDLVFIPVISFSHKHYYRIFGKIGHAGEISKLLKEINFVSYCSSCANRKIGGEKKCDFCGANFKILGPIFIGKINDAEFCGAVEKDLAKRNFRQKNSEAKLMRELAAESIAPAFYFDISRVCYLHKKKSMPLQKIIEKLEKKRFTATRTVFCENGIKTDAGLKDVLKVISK